MHYRIAFSRIHTDGDTRQDIFDAVDSFLARRCGGEFSHGILGDWYDLSPDHRWSEFFGGDFILRRSSNTELFDSTVDTLRQEQQAEFQAGLEDLVRSFGDMSARDLLTSLHDGEGITWGLRFKFQRVSELCVEHAHCEMGYYDLNNHSTNASLLQHELTISGTDPAFDAWLCIADVHT